jgi:hypothetical protein
VVSEGDTLRMPGPSMGTSAQHGEQKKSESDVLVRVLSALPEFPHLVLLTAVWVVLSQFYR